MKEESSAASCWLDRLAYLWVVPVAYYFFNIARYATNTPYGDDIDLIVGNTASILNAPDFLSTLPTFFIQQSEYQTFFITLSGLVSTWLLGYIDLYAITMVGNVGLFAALFFLVYKLAKNSAEFNVLALIAFLFLAAPVHGDCSIWSNCTIGQFGSIFMGSLVSLFLARSGILNFVLFEIGMIAAVLTQGNGMAFFPIGFLGIWLFQRDDLKKPCYVVHGLVITTVLWLIVRFFDHTTSTLMHDAILRTLASPFVLVKTIPLWVLGWVGSWAAWQNNLVLAVGVGLIEVSILGYWVLHYRKKIFNDYPHACLLITYLVATIGVAAVLRACYGAEVQLLFVDRYKTYSLCLAIGIVLLLLSLLKNSHTVKGSGEKYWRKAVTGTVMFSLVYFLTVNYSKQHFFSAFKNRQLRCAAAWVETGIAKPCLWHGNNKVLMDSAVALHILYLDKNGGQPLRCDGDPVYAKYCWK